MNTISGPTRWMAAGCFAAAGLLVGQGPAAAQPPHEQHRPQGHDAHSRHLEHRFDDPERYARSFDDPARDVWQMPERVIAALDIAAGEAVADIGAGTGYFTVRIAEQTAARVVFAVDIEPAMVDHVRERAAEAGLAQVAGVLAAPDSPNLPEPVDVALIVNTFHHIADRVAYSGGCATRWRRARGWPSSTTGGARRAAARPTSSASRRTRSTPTSPAPATGGSHGTTSCSGRASSSTE